MSEIKAIETRYKGFHFRSRLEARWAVFFDAMGWQWRYEPQGYDIGGEYYLPDFWVDRIGWVEVKGALGEFELARLLDASRHLPESLDGKRAAPGRNVRAIATKLLILGDIPDPVEPWAHLQFGVDGIDSVVWRFAILGIPGAFPLTDWLRSPTTPDMYASIAAWASGRSATWINPLRAVSAAYSAARSARFEHGQKGAA